MKKKQSKIRTPKKRANEKETAFPQPQAIELAMLGAILRPDAPNPTDAFKAALVWYCKAVLFTREKASLQIRFLLEQMQKESGRAKGLKKAQALHAKHWNDTVDFDEARRLLADPRQLAQRFNKLPKKGEQFPESGMTETPLHELPGWISKSKTDRPLSDHTLANNVLKAWEYFAPRYRVAPGAVIAVRKHLEKMLANGKVPTFLLEAVLRYRYETRKETLRKSWRGRKSSTEI